MWWQDFLFFVKKFIIYVSSLFSVKQNQKLISPWCSISHTLSS